MLINYALWCGKLKKKLNGLLVMSRKYWKMDTVEHLYRSPSTQNDFWNYPSPDDIETLSEEQIIPCKIDGDWEPTNNTSTRVDFKFHLRNSSAIENTFKRLMNL